MRCYRYGWRVEFYADPSQLLRVWTLSNLTARSDRAIRQGGTIVLWKRFFPIEFSWLTLNDFFCFINACYRDEVMSKCIRRF